MHTSPDTVTFIIEIDTSTGPNEKVKKNELSFSQFIEKKAMSWWSSIFILFFSEDLAWSMK